jgi:phosphomannomutase
VLFDLDDTLAPSFESPTLEMLAEIHRLLYVMPVAILTGRDFSWMARDFLPAIAKMPHVERFYVLPEGAAQCWHWNEREWELLYGEKISEDERSNVVKIIRQTVAETGVLQGLSHYGEQIVLKKTMVSFAMLGMQVPKGQRYSWDPGNVRRQKLRDALAAKLPEYDVVLGGATTVDVTKKGINKAHGVTWLSERLNIPPAEMLFVGDALFREATILWCFQQAYKPAQPQGLTRHSKS